MLLSSFACEMTLRLSLNDFITNYLIIFSSSREQNVTQFSKSNIMIRIFPYINVLIISHCQKQLKQAVKDQQFKIHIDDSSRRKRKKLESCELASDRFVLWNSFSIQVTTRATYLYRGGRLINRGSWLKLWHDWVKWISTGVIALVVHAV